ncbi:genetic competence negative regulator [Staphylospora marina]|uniref:genetic competence negative regulator n=1 Tax=Staphylospora marina TaxID=2490858 RepID=UPI000F5BDD62|nr:genetic competence negative regulator [Staphylospora marina]
MRVERLGGDKIRFFLTLDDLADRGIEKEDMWRDIPKVHELFRDMMEQAYEELGFEVAGPVAVEVFALPAQGMVVVVTRGRAPKPEDAELMDEDHEDLYQLEVTMEETEDIVFRFADFEDLLQAVIRVRPLVKRGGKVFAWENRYFLLFGKDLETESVEDLVAILSEYGEASAVTEAWLEEYGKIVCPADGVAKLVDSFAPHA